MKLNLSLFNKLFRPALILAVLFMLLLAAEAYFLYYKVYGNLSTGIDDLSVDVNIVRLDINNYNKMINHLDELQSYTPSNPILENPFR